ncbi:male-specific lethal 3 homolog isoform X5 [Ostrinia furnacalis]|uniref:male-specific lethal 3 homolog isoform X5 n=1 Tax=Ostrinia furnacalis TaxID=93504 RepID=UPI00103EE3DE|nr:male-specific lethal 3 homolog isoform X5 [Ostrinia furnacalis]
MVSTRGIRYKFSEGERVLCYEPDPTKAKVLYDSKVLEVIESKDKRGRRTVEYLIHFQGWNSSWDRCVSEDFVLKDTEENRQLQRDLAEKSQLQLGAYLYRRERKKGSTGAAPGPAKRPRQGFSDDGSSSSTQPDGNVYVTTEGEAGDTDSSASGSGAGSGSCSGSGAGSGSQRRSPPPNAHVGRAHITLPSALRLNLVREVADGLRVYFDFILRGHLLYKQELNQYHEICGQYIEEQELELKTELEDEVASQDEAMASAEEDLKSPKIPEYSHLPPDPVDSEKQEGSPSPTSQPDEPMKLECDLDIKQEPADDASSVSFASACSRRDRARAGHVARRLRSHKSAASEAEEPLPSTSGGSEPRAFETQSSSVGSSGSSLSEPWPRAMLPGRAPAAPTPTRTPLSLLLDKVAKWQIIPREGTEHLPCRVYGAIHLARLFVKLPDFLNATQMPDFKLKLILKHIDMFVQYLDEHNEWFGEMYYVADNMSRSH